MSNAYAEVCYGWKASRYDVGREWNPDVIGDLDENRDETLTWQTDDENGVVVCGVELAQFHAWSELGTVQAAVNVPRPDSGSAAIVIAARDALPDWLQRVMTGEPTLFLAWGYG